MAKKRKPRKRAPGPVRPGGVGVRPPSSPPGSDDAARAERRQAAKQRRAAEQARRLARKRRGQLRNLAIVTGLAAALLGYTAWRVSVSQSSGRKYDRLAAAAGCGPIVKTDDSGVQQHLKPGQAVKYDHSPPTHGPHAPDPLRANVYDKPFSDDPASTEPTIYGAVHSLEHGYVIVWYKGISDARIGALEKAFGGERKVIVVPYPKLKGGKMAMTVWARVQTCQQPDVKLIRSFITRFREKTGPEPTAA